MTDLDICICTFRRPGVADTIRSVLAQEVPEGFALRVIVVDNDDEPTARPLVEDLSRDTPLRLLYIHHPGRNISVARNAALDAGTARYTAFLDDDEVARPGWLMALAQARTGETEVILGPVEPVYPAGSPTWMRDTVVHGTRPVRVGGAIRTGYTCNVLIDRARPEIRALRFDPELGRSGGEDTDYFARMARLGASFAYAPKAVVEEPVVPERLSFSWLAQRRYRMGLTHARVLLRCHAARPWRAVPVAAAKMLACALMAVAFTAHRGRRNAAVLRGFLHAGVVAGLSGAAPPVLYGATPHERQGSTP
ncbi:MAG: succinoglycan biosynthesis protein ExoM [Rhodobacteraceae bacterium HLUCCO18]|nr:MAG: succinoglycan biosynthesis protein ExoM [Rhodobacteraceae bacterium HLUCCO18]